MKRFTDIFVKKPVLATVVSLLIFIVGFRAIYSMQLREYPEMENTVITVSTTYPGASASLVQGFVTTPIEQAVASADGVDYFSSSSTDSLSTITLNIKLNYDPNAAFTSVMSKVQQISNQLPSDAQQPVITKTTGSSIALLYLNYSSTEMSRQQITAYLSEVVQPQLETVSGVAGATILGGQTYAMRVWLDPNKMAALGVSPIMVSQALTANNYQTAAGSVNSGYVQISVSAETGLSKEADFEDLTIKTGASGAIVRLRDVARVELGSTNYNSSVYFNGESAVFIAIDSTPTANPLTVINDVKKILPGIQAKAPSALKSTVVYDATDYIRDSIKEVIKTIVEASIIVILIIFLFLGSLRTVLIPVVTLPLSLVGVFGIMLLMGYSINILTLLALVLAIGMVVDDAIVVVENTYRHIEEGATPFDAAIQGAREIAMPIISMTITLAAVYAPIGLMGGLTGSLFTEFAFTLAGSVILSGVIALTLSPMMCSKILSSEIGEQRFVKFIDGKFNSLKNVYHKALDNLLNHRPVVVFFAFVVLVSCAFLFAKTPSELAPMEDQGLLLFLGTAPEYANIDYVEKYSSELQGYFKEYPAFENGFVINGYNGVNTMLGMMLLKPWEERTKKSDSQDSVYRSIQNKTRNIAGMQTIPLEMSSLPTSTGGYPIQFILQSTGSYESLYTQAEALLDKVNKSGLFLFATNSLDFNKPEISVKVDRNKAALLGINMSDVGNALAVALGENYINWFSLYNHGYEVIPQLDNQYRLNGDDLTKLYVTTSTGKVVPLSTIVTISNEINANSLTRFSQLNSATISAIPIPMMTTTSQALAFLQQAAKETLSSDISYDYAGDLRTYVEEGDSLVYTFLFSIIIIFLVLAAQFESFRDPLVIMTSVPMAISGALIPLALGFATINIYSEIGLITLIGLISKHGILMVEFAKQLKEEKGYDLRQAIVHSAAVRLRPVLMTTFAMILGVIPLVLASGAGAVSRFNIGLTISSGMFIGTLFTLFVVPTMYTLSAKQILKFLVSAILTALVLSFILL